MAAVVLVGAGVVGLRIAVRQPVPEPMVTDDALVVLPPAANNGFTRLRVLAEQIDSEPYTEAAVGMRMAQDPEGSEDSRWEALSHGRAERLELLGIPSKKIAIQRWREAVVAPHFADVEDAPYFQIHRLGELQLMDSVSRAVDQDDWQAAFIQLSASIAALSDLVGSNRNFMSAAVGSNLLVKHLAIAHLLLSRQEGLAVQSRARLLATVQSLGEDGGLESRPVLARALAGDYLQLRGALETAGRDGAQRLKPQGWWPFGGSFDTGHTISILDSRYRVAGDHLGLDLDVDPTVDPVSCSWVQRRITNAAGCRRMDKVLDADAVTSATQRTIDDLAQCQTWLQRIADLQV